MQIDFLVGNIASGKSTYCRDYPDACIISKDEIRKAIYPGKYIYDVNTEYLIDVIATTKLKAAKIAGCPHIIIDGTNMSEHSRFAMLQVAKAYGKYAVYAVVFGDRGEDDHVKCRMQENHGDTPESVWREVYRRKKAAYAEPSTSEGFSGVIFLDDSQQVFSMKNKGDKYDS